MDMEATPTLTNVFRFQYKPVTEQQIFFKATAVKQVHCLRKSLTNDLLKPEFCQMNVSAHLV
jgi:hypothetical protein